ncbi:MAG: hypothetical protein LBG08_06430, partial [Spirochaetaceae bacterium]|nr:hypothetical protein [Spirochaetaceae bacterium]
QNAAHPYSKALIDCIPRGRAGAGTNSLPVIPGFPPRLYDPPAGCPFAPRCNRAGPACRVLPPGADLGNGRYAACHYPIPAGGASPGRGRE